MKSTNINATRFTNGFLDAYPRFASRMAATAVVLAGFLAAPAQGTVNFNGYAYWSGTSYIEQGMQFRVVTPTPGSHDDMGVAPTVTTPSNIPYNSSPYLFFVRQVSPDDYVAFGLTNESSFGLASVQLADPSSPSSTAIPIIFEGFKADGSTVTNTFTTPGNGADHLLNYQFTSDFASGLTSVDILATRWAMDNLVFAVPEPSVLALMVLGVAGFLVRRHRSRR
jgi:hypothetical protein